MIKVDMFEVQLGAALLLQFKTREGPAVRVLADAGVGQGIPARHVHDKLPDAFESFAPGDHRIDLIIGTHYDADHLDGLIPIIRDESVAISEAWLPPVANDTELHFFDKPVDDHDFLAKQFYADDHHGALFRYLKTKRKICEQLRPKDAEAADRDRSAEWNEDNIDRALELFKTYRDEAISSVGSDPGLFTHADDDQFNPAELKELLELIAADHLWSGRFYRRFLYRKWLHYDPDAFLAKITSRMRKKSEIL